MPSLRRRSLVSAKTIEELTARLNAAPMTNPSLGTNRSWGEAGAVILIGLGLIGCILLFLSLPILLLAWLVWHYDSNYLVASFGGICIMMWLAGSAISPTFLQKPQRICTTIWLFMNIFILSIAISKNISAYWQFFFCSLWSLDFFAHYIDILTTNAPPRAKKDQYRVTLSFGFGIVALICAFLFLAPPSLAVQYPWLETYIHSRGAPIFFLGYVFLTRVLGSSSTQPALL